MDDRPLTDEIVLTFVDAVAPTAQRRIGIEKG
jgi:hypothetical protein